MKVEIEAAAWPEESGKGPRWSVGSRLAKAAIEAKGGTVRTKLTGRTPETVATVARQTARRAGYKLATTTQDDGYVYAKVIGSVE